MKFSQALDLIHNGCLLRRAGWNGKRMHIELVTPDKGGNSPGCQYSMLVDNAEVPPAQLLPFIAMYTADGQWVPWLCPQTDAMASDWETIEERGK